MDSSVCCGLNFVVSPCAVLTHVQADFDVLHFGTSLLWANTESAGKISEIEAADFSALNILEGGE